jgi:F0F1-type ATP synthase membrane subunit c/vacuolar-type H+-ATPase subunit K
MVPLSCSLAGAGIAVGASVVGASVADELSTTGAAVGVADPHAVSNMDTATSTDNMVKVCFLICISYLV